ncbi:unnamed protein product [Rotaria sp. Silwood2]|nr:unnamed protein product [Rotaria sp. Silwood2]
MSIDAFAAAFHGRLLSVKKFLHDYPEWKDKSGLWQTTLLYSAARADRLEMIQYLIEEAHCAINAQNQRRDDEITEAGSSTALHNACSNGHLTIAKYLVEHGADYFIRNQVGETPIMAGDHHAHIKQYFQDYLLIKYSMDVPPNLPDRKFSDDARRPMADGWWEYKPIRDPKWYKFSKIAADELQKTLLPSKEFQQQVYLSLGDNYLYFVSTVDFFRSGNYAEDPEGKVAWIRSRASSIFNFDCHALWQIMLLKHPNASASSDATPPMKVESIPETSDRTFPLQLNTWYRCNTKTNRLFEDAMDMRRKIIRTHIDMFGENLEINFETYDLTNQDKTIVGYLRWLPQLISDTERKKHRIVEIDNYQPMTNLVPVPLSTKHLRDVVAKGANDSGEYFSADDEDDDGDDSGIAETAGTKDTDDVSDDDQQPEVGDKNQSNEENTTDSHDAPVVSKTEVDPLAEAFFHPTVGQLKQTQLVEKANGDENKKIVDDMMAVIRSANEKLKDQVEKERRKVELRTQREEKSTSEAEQRLKQTLERLERLQQQLDKHNNRERTAQALMSRVKTVEYINIEADVVHNFLYMTSANITEHLSGIEELDELIKGKIPKVFIRERNTSYLVSVTGLQSHHDEFKLVLKRIRTLGHLTRSAKDYYERQLRRVITDIHRSLIIKEIPSLSDWICYRKILRKLMQTEMETYVKHFEDYIIKEAKDIVHQCIENAHFQSWVSIHKKTNDYLKKHSFSAEIEGLKQKALDEFFTEQVNIRPSHSQRPLSSASVRVMNEYIYKLKNEFKTDRRFIGTSEQQFRHTAYLLQRIMLYYRTCLLQLPLYASSKELLAKVQHNTVMTITTSTGSGKSTLLPALLIAEGYDRVFVTQPRRLPCTSICNRVNQTMTNNKDQFPLAGWSVSGAKGNKDAQILYLTDGLLKERLLFNPNFIMNDAKGDNGIILFVDEVHERSINIDLCLALIARLLIEQPALRLKLKVIISSATLDKSLPDLYRQIPHLKFDQYQMPFSDTLHKVEKFYRPKENVLDVVQELCRKRQRHDQILCFVSSVTDVHQYCRLLNKISQGMVVAHPLVQSQSASEQQQCIEHGTIFFSTTVAETSLTFPSLKYVVDTGLINVPTYDPKAKQTTLREISASESTIKQRLGRLGRTRPGEYHALYDLNAVRPTYPVPYICQSNLIDVEFSLRRSSLKNGLSHLQKFLPDPPRTELIDTAVEELKSMIVPPRMLKQPMRKSCMDIEERISHITDSKWTTIDLWNGLRGSKATRETRMAVVAWIVVCMFDCHVEGGFVRDWVVGHYQARPAGPPSTWVSRRTNPAGATIPEISKEVVPTDLDCHLSVHKYFDLDKFLDCLHKYQIKYSYVREDWRYIFLLDEDAKTGPFTMDLIEPHVALTQDRIDFDVNNLSLEKDHTKELGMRVDTRPKPYSIDLEAIVDNIKHKRFQLLRPNDPTMNQRIQKMVSRGWTKTGEDLNFIPHPPPRCEVIVVPVPEIADIYRSVVQQLQSNIGSQVKILSIVQIKNPSLEEAYLAIKQLIAKDCQGGNSNERPLFHGTSGTSIDGILNNGFDDRYWRAGKWGKCHGAYFAENPLVSHGFAHQDSSDQTRVMFYNKVTLGKQQILRDTNMTLQAAPIGFHSVHGIPSGSSNEDEFIVYRYAQALPYLKITYRG